MLQALRGSESNIPGKRYNKRKTSKRKKRQVCGAEQMKGVRRARGKEKKNLAWFC